MCKYDTAWLRNEWPGLLLYGFSVWCLGARHNRNVKVNCHKVPLAESIVTKSLWHVTLLTCMSLHSSQVWVGFQPPEEVL